MDAGSDFLWIPSIRKRGKMKSFVVSVVSSAKSRIAAEALFLLGRRIIVKILYESLRDGQYDDLENINNYN